MALYLLRYGKTLYNLARVRNSALEKIQPPNLSPQDWHTAQTQQENPTISPYYLQVTMTPPQSIFYAILGLGLEVLKAQLGFPQKQSHVE